MFRTYCFALTALATAAPGEDAVFLRETFDSLDDWRDVKIPKVEKKAQFTIQKEGRNGYLKAGSDGGASGLASERLFDTHEVSKVTWRWKVDTACSKEDLQTKAGDDAPLRVCIVFEFDPGEAGFFELLEYKAAKAVNGEYPPHSSLMYIWSGKRYRDRILTSPYTGRAKIVVLESGPANRGTWRAAEVDILKDYKAAFGADPPKRAGIVIMCDSDNTGESTRAYVDDIAVRRTKGGKKP